MMEQFIDRTFTTAWMDVIEQANAIIDEYQEQGFTLTLRQIYYQFVSRDLIPNRQTEYKRLGAILNEARQAGLVDWSAIEDRERNVKAPPAWDDPETIIGAAAEGYQEDLWRNQSCRPEVWVEKSALVGVIEPVCNRWRLPFLACRGYRSQSEQYAAGVRFRDLIADGITPIVLDLHDHDPSGIDMTRDNRTRLELFAGEPVEVIRLALNMDQVEQYRPPPNPTKLTDSRAGKADPETGEFPPASYIGRFGKSCWELDALDPTVIDGLIEAAVRPLIDHDAWAADIAAEEVNRQKLQDVSRLWPDVTAFLFGDGSAE